jgi:predicted esterase
MAGDTPARRPPIVIAPPVPSSTAPATLIFIHGYNALNTQFNCDPPDASSVAYHIHKSLALQHVKIVIPEGIPNLWPSMNRATWYNIATPVPQPGSPQNVYEQIEFGHSGSNENDMNLNLDYFESLIESEIAGGTPAKRIIFVGYSQGATILTLFIVTRKLAADLGAIISIAGFPPVPMQSISRMQQENGLFGPWSKETYFFMLHGRNDVFIPLEIFFEWRKRIEGFRDRGQGIANVEWKLVDGMKHAMATGVWPHVREILEEAVPVTDPKPSVKL